MVICSCNELDTGMIKECLVKNPEATAKEIMKELDWQPECSVCVYNLINEINQKIVEIKNGDQL